MVVPACKPQVQRHDRQPQPDRAGNCRSVYATCGTHLSPCSSVANSRQLGCTAPPSAAPGQWRSSHGCSAARLPVEAAPAPNGEGGSALVLPRMGVRPRGEPQRLPRTLG